jgi:hypothetical protein
VCLNSYKIRDQCFLYGRKKGAKRAQKRAQIFIKGGAQIWAQHGRKKLIQGVQSGRKKLIQGVQSGRKKFRFGENF